MIVGLCFAGTMYVDADVARTQASVRCYVLGLLYAVGGNILAAITPESYFFTEAFEQV